MDNKLIGIINGDLYGKRYNNVLNNSNKSPKNLNEKKEILYKTLSGENLEIYKQNNGEMNFRLRTGIEYDSAFNEAESYSVSKMNEIINKIKDASENNKKIYFWDTETIGMGPNMAKAFKETYKRDSEIAKIFSVTEMYLGGVEFADGKVKNITDVINFSSGLNNDKFSLIDNIRSKTSPSKSEISALQRLAGAAGETYNDKGFPINFNENADYTNPKLVESGFNNLVEANRIRFGDGNPTDKPNYLSIVQENKNKEIRNIYDTMAELINDDAMIIGANTDAFDKNVLKDMFLTAQIPEDMIDDLLDSDNFIDIQKVLKQTASTDIYRAMDEQGMKADLKISSAVELLGLETAGDNHVAKTDTINTAKITAAMQDKFDKFQDEINKAVNIDSNSSILFSNKAIKNISPYDFKTMDGELNSYSNYSTSRGAAYKVSFASSNDTIYKIEMNKYLEEKHKNSNIPKKDILELSDNIEEINNKHVAILEDISEGGSGNKSFMFFDNINDFQDLIDKGDITLFEDTQEIRDMIKRNSDNIAMENKMNLMNSFKDSSKSKTSGFDKLNNLFKGYKIEKEFGSDSLEFNEHFSKNGSPMLERLRDYNVMKDEFANNEKYYEDIVNSINTYVDNTSIKFSKTLQSQEREIKKNIKTKIYHDVTENFENKLMESVNKDDIVDYLLNKDDVVKEKINSKIIEEKNAYIEKVKDKWVSSDNIDVNNFNFEDKAKEKRIIENEIEKHYNINLNEKNDTLKNLLFDKVKGGDNYNSIQTLDILSPDGDGFTTLSLKNKDSFEKSLKNNIYVKVTGDTKNAKEYNRRKYLNEIVKDLNDRGILNENESRAITGRVDGQNVQASIDILADTMNTKMNTIFDVVNSANGVPKDSSNLREKAIMALELKDINYEKMEQSQKDILNQLDKFRVKDVFYDSHSSSFMGVSIGDIVNNLEGFEEAINISVDKYSDLYTPKFLHSSYSRTKNEFNSQLGDLKDFFMKEDGLNWSSEQSEYFTKNVINKVERRTNIDHSKQGRKVLDILGDNGAVTMFIEDADNKKAYMTISNKEKTNFILNNQKDLEKIKEKAFVFELPRIDRIGDIEYIDQGEDSVKVITKNIKKINSNKNEIIKYRNTDSFEAMVDSLSRSMYFIADDIENEEYAVATSKGTKAMKEIYEKKPINGFSLRPSIDEKTGKIIINNTMGINIGDYNLQNVRNITDLSKSIDYIIDENTATGLKLKNKFYENVPFPEKSISRIKDIKTTFSDLDDPTKLFFTANIQDVATSLLENKEFMSENKEIKDFLKRMSESGSMYLKDSGDAAKGFASSTSPLYYNPDSLYSSVTRPLDNQTHQANVYYKDDSLMWLKFNYSDTGILGDISNDELLKKMNIKGSHGSFTDSKLIADRYARLINKGQSFGLTTTVSKMTSENFIKRSMSLKENEKAINSIKESLFSKYNVNVSNDKLIETVNNILNVSNLYEDSGIMSPLFAATLPGKTTKTYKIDSEIGKEIAYSDYVGKFLTKDNELGKKIGYKDRDALIIGYNEKNNKFRIQLNHDYRDTKFAFATDEKAVMHAPIAKDLKEAVIIDEVMKKITGGANLAYNPGYKKHESFTAVINPYKNAILNGIDNDKDMEVINSMLSERFKNHPMKITYDDNASRYIFVSDDMPKGEINIFEEYQDFFNEIKSKKDEGSVFKNISKSFDDIEVVAGNDIESKTNLLYMDLFLAKDNTIENVQGAENIGKGATSTYRGSAVTGLYLSDASIEASRNIKGDTFEKLFDDVIRERQDLVFNIPNNADKLKQSSNIYQTLIKTYVDNSDGGELYGSENSKKITPYYIERLKNENFVVQKISLEDALRGRSGISAAEMPVVFSSNALNENGQRINAYEIDLSDLKVKIRQPISSIKDENKLIMYNPKEYINKITIPAMSPNVTADNKAFFAETQKKAADLLDTIHKIETGNIKGRSVEDVGQRLPKLYEDFLNNMVNELVSKNGLLKQGMSGKIPFSSRNKIGKISAPILDVDNKILDPGFKNLVHKTKDTEKMFNVVKIGLSGFEDRGLNLTEIGRQMLKEDLDSSELAMNITSELREKAKDITNDKVLDDLLYSYGEKYLKEVGISGMISRDPVMLSTSEMATKTYLDTSIVGEIASIDSATASFLNADGDGDEINIFLNDLLYKDENGIVKIKNKDSKQYKSFEKKLNVQAEMNYLIMDDIIRSNIEKSEANKTIHRVAEYSDYIKESRGEDFVKNPNYSIHESTSIAGQMARVMKGEIGYISNPNYYIKNAVTSYYSQGTSVADLRDINKINKFLDTTEQKLIDTKSIKRMDQSIGLSELAENYAKNFDEIANLKASKKRKLNIIQDLYYDIGKLDIIPSKMKSDVTRDYAMEVAERILNGAYSADDELEESLGIITKVLSNDKARKAYFSPFTRQSMISKHEGKYMDIIDKMAYVINKNDSESHESIQYVLGNAYIQDSVFVRDKDRMRALNLDDILSIQGNKYIDDGVYKVEHITRDRRDFSIKLRDILEKENTRVIMGDNFIDLSSKIKNDAKIIDNVKEAKNIAINKYKKRVTKDIISNYDSFEKYSGIFSNIQSMNNEDLSIKQLEIKKIFNNINDDGIKAMEDAHLTITELKNQKYIKESDAYKAITKINNNIIKNGTKDYREFKRKTIFESNLNISLNNVAYDEFMKNKIYPNFTNVKNNTMIENDIKSFKELRRYDIDKKINDIINNNNIVSGMNLGDISKENIDTLKDIFIEKFKNKFKNIDKENLGKINELIDKNQFNKEFLSKALNINLDTINNDIIVPYGKYAGFNVKELDTDILKSILSENSDKKNNSLMQHVNMVIENVIEENKSTGFSRDAIPNLDGFDISDIKKSLADDDILKKINEETRRRGAERAKGTNGFSKSDIKKMTNESKVGSTKGLLIAGGVIAAIMGASYMAGKDFTANKKVLSTENDANKESKESQNNNKSNKKGPSRSNNQYMEEEGANYEISALSRDFKNAKHPVQLVSSIANRGSSAISTYVTDDRRDFESHEINDMIVNCDF